MGSTFKNLQESLESLEIKEDDSKLIIWDNDTNSCVVPNPRGAVWSTIGRVVNSKMTVTPEEALYLAEFSNYKFVRDCQLLSPELFLSLFPDKVFDSYKIYRDLRRHGYILMPQDSPYFPFECLFTNSYAEWSLFKPNSGFKKSKPTGHLGQLVPLRKTCSIGEVAKNMNVPEHDNTKFMFCLSDGPAQVSYFEAMLCHPIPEPPPPQKSKCKSNKYV